MSVPLKGLATQDLMEVLLVSRAAFESNTTDELIRELLRHLERIFRTGNSNFFFARHLARALNLERVITRGIEDKFITQFRDYYHRLDPFFKGLLLPRVRLLTTEQLISFKDLIRCEYYNDFLKPQSIHYQMSIILKSEQRLLGVLSLFRPRNAKDFSSLDRAKADLMAPYLAGAVEKSIISDKMSERKSFIDSIVTRLPFKGIMILDASLDPIYQDENAVRIMSNLKSVNRSGEESFEALPKEINLRCKDFLSCAGKEETSGLLQHQFHFVSPGEKQKISIHLRLIPQLGKNPLLLLCLDPEEHPLCHFKRSKEHRLTGREIEVVSLLSEGLTNRGIGEKLFISEYTVENHLRSIYKKMGVKNRTSLVHRIMQLTSTENWFTHSMPI